MIDLYILKYDCQKTFKRKNFKSFLFKGYNNSNRAENLYVLKYKALMKESHHSHIYKKKNNYSRSKAKQQKKFVWNGDIISHVSISPKAEPIRSLLYPKFSLFGNVGLKF